MSMQRDGRPLGEADGLQETAFGGTSIVPRFTPEMAAARSQGMLLLMVHDPASGRFRRRIFLTVHAAEKAAKRAIERGQVAHVVLGEFHPLGVV